jgi:hypothetical protein
MSTTLLRDSIVGDAWITQTMQQVPISYVLDEKTGERTGDILTGPVRLAFDTLFELPKPTPQMENPKYGAALLFPPTADFSIMYEEYYKVCAAEFASHYDGATQQYHGLHSPFRDQAEKLKFGGFTPGAVFMTCTSKFKPPVIDARGNPVVDPSKVYPGVWAICALNSYAYKDPRKKGVGFGLQSVMLIGDDTKFGGGAPDPNKTFGAAKGAIAPPPVQAGHLQNAGANSPPPNGAPPGTGAMPGAPAGGTYAAPPTGAPGAGQYQMPGQPAAAPPAGGSSDPRGPVPAGYDSWGEYDDLMG